MEEGMGQLLEAEDKEECWETVSAGHRRVIVRINP